MNIWKMVDTEKNSPVLFKLYVLILIEDIIL